MSEAKRQRRLRQARDIAREDEVRNRIELLERGKTRYGTPAQTYLVDALIWELRWALRKVQKQPHSTIGDIT